MAFPEIWFKFSLQWIASAFGQAINETDKLRAKLQETNDKVKSSIAEAWKAVAKAYDAEKAKVKELEEETKRLTKAKKDNLDVTKWSQTTVIQKAEENIKNIKIQQQELNKLTRIEENKAKIVQKEWAQTIKQLQAEIKLQQQLERQIKLTNWATGWGAWGGRWPTLWWTTSALLTTGTLWSVARSALPLAVWYAVGRTAVSAVTNDIDLDKEMLQVYNAAGATTPEAKAMLKQQVLQTSSSTGIAATEYAKWYAQLISSAAFSPWQVGSKDYTANLQAAGNVASQLALSAKATGTDAREYMDAITYTANAAHLDLKQQANLTRVQDIMAYAQKMGKGTMGEYSQAFAKFIPDIGSAGMSLEDAAWTYAALTNVYSPQMAGTAMQHFMKLKSTAPVAQQYMSTRLETLSGGGTQQIVADAEDNATLMALRGKWVRNMWFDSKWNAKDYKEILKGISDEYAKLHTKEAQWLFKSLFSKNDMSTQRVLSLITGTATDENGNPIAGTAWSKVISDIIWGKIAGTNQMNIDNLNTSISWKWDKMTETWKNGMIWFVTSAEPALNDTITALTMIAEQLPKIGQAFTATTWFFEWVWEKIYDALHPEEARAREAEKARNKMLQNPDISTAKTSGVGRALVSEDLRNAMWMKIEWVSYTAEHGRAYYSIKEQLAETIDNQTPLQRLQAGRSTSLWDILWQLSSEQQKPVGEVLPIARGLISNQLESATAAWADTATITSLQETAKALDSMINDLKKTDELVAQQNMMIEQARQQTMYLAQISVKDFSVQVPYQPRSSDTWLSSSWAWFSNWTTPWTTSAWSWLWIK